MKTNLQFIDQASGSNSRCAEHFHIVESSRKLEWHGILLEKGSSDYFISDHIMTKDFFFAMELKYEFDWTISVDGIEVEVHSHIEDIWINAPLSPFSHCNNNKSEFLVMTIEPKVLFESYDGYLPKEDLKFLSDYSIHDEFIGHMMKMMLLEVQLDGSNGSQFIQHLIKLFSNYYINNYSNINSLNKSGHLYSVISKDKMALIDDYIYGHISDNISIDDLAKVLGMNKFHFLNEFKKVMNITPYQYLISKRVEKAKDLLQNTDRTLVDIALDLGFNDSSHFTRTFKKYTHQTPRHYKLSLR